MNAIQTNASLAKHAFCGLSQRDRHYYQYITTSQCSRIKRIETSFISVFLFGLFCWYCVGDNAVKQDNAIYFVLCLSIMYVYICMLQSLLFETEPQNSYQLLARCFLLANQNVSKKIFRSVYF
jgi:hypothetical protein